jgi:hypothetical protein
MILEDVKDANTLREDEILIVLEEFVQGSVRSRVGGGGEKYVQIASCRGLRELDVSREKLEDRDRYVGGEGRRDSRFE